MIDRAEVLEMFHGKGFPSVRFLKNPYGPGTVIITILPVRRKAEGSVEEAPVAPFAAANHYGEAVSRLKDISREFRKKTGLAKRDIRIFSNSTLPEKQLAALSGLGFYGRNSLIITREAGSRAVLAGMIVPLELPPDSPLERGTVPGALCGSCRNCMESCPTGAIEGGGRINRDKCLQSLATDDRILPLEIMEKWGNRIYGCTLCQDCCPFNRNRELLPLDDIEGKIGETLTFRFLLTAGDEDIKEKLRGTALGLSWIKPFHLRRNAIISLPFCEDRTLVEESRPLVAELANDPQLGYAVRWTLGKIISAE